jgi:transposase
MGKKVDINNVNVWSDGKLQLAVGLCEKIGIIDLFNKHLENSLGRPSDIPAGTEAAIMIASIADDGYKPLSGFQNYYRYKDLEAIFHHPVKLEQLNDDRFGHFLDDFYDAGCRQIFMEASSLAFAEYGFKIVNINYDTTSKVMWGKYETTNHLEYDGRDTSYISIDFGHSKDKRNDKKQIKIGIGTANGIVADAKVLSGNMDDKTYNNENLEDLDQLLTQMDVNRDEFYYIADSALFTAENIAKANENKISFITRMPDNTKLAKRFLANPLPEDAQVIEVERAKGEPAIYRLTETEDKYKGHSCKFAIVYSTQLEESKQKTCQKKIKKEEEEITKSLKKYNKRNFKCRPDAEKEIRLLNDKVASKLKFYDLNLYIKENETRRPGRPSKNPEDDIERVEYQLSADIVLNDVKVEEYIRQQCTFILASNDLSISGEKMLREYKTQSQVEKRFRNLKSPKYMNSLFLKSPKRVEALVYLLLIVLMILTIAEKVVRKGLKKTDDLVIGIDRRKLKQPTLDSILQIIDRVRTVTYKVGGKTYREIRELDDSCKKIIGFLRLKESCFAWNGGSNSS